MMAILSRMRFRQFFRQKDKTMMLGKVLIIVYFWLLEVLLYFALRKEGISSLPPLLITVVCFSFIVPDFIFKLIFLRDQTVMDAFLKTRPVPQTSWDRFLTQFQFWRASNLAMPLILAPACLLFLPFPYSLLVLLILYLFSVFGGFMVMLIKHRGNYQLENTVSSSAHIHKQGEGHHIFGLQTRSLMRSKRLKTMLFIFSLYVLLEFIIFGLQGEKKHYYPILLLLIMFPTIISSQYGLGIEAKFFSCIWTKPLSICRILSEKYLFSALLGWVAALVAVPLCFWFHIPAYAPLSFALFATGVGVLAIMSDPYKCTPLDLFGKTFFNTQGASGTYKVSTILGMIFTWAFPVLLLRIVPEVAVHIILSVLGIAGYLVHRAYFRWVERQFMKNKYKYLEKYLSI